MAELRVCEVAVPLPLPTTFTYRIPEGIAEQVAAGVRVRVPFQSRRLVGVVTQLGDGPAGAGTPQELKDVLEVVDSEPLLTPLLLKLAGWITDYYFAPPGEVLRAMLPLSERGRKPRTKRAPTNRPGPDLPLLEDVWSAAPDLVLSGEQTTALAAIERQLEAGTFATILVHGVTASGKTEIYARAIERCTEQGRAALVLVPEIALTPAVSQRFQMRFGELVAVLHSGLGARERAQAWWRLRRGEARVAVGTRSAVFAPLSNVGLVIVDEEQDASYKQEETPRYHGRDVAVVRAKLEGAVAVLGSATPSLESSFQARSGKYHLVRLERRVAERPLASVGVVDMRQEFEETKKTALFSRRLREAVSETLASGGQVLMLLNRRGYASFLLCRKCGAAVLCVNCSISLTYHRARQRLLCHYCGFARALPSRCPKCDSEHLYWVGEGTEKVEQTLRELFPAARVGRLDRDTARRKRAHERILGQFARGGIDILTGTQMIAKGHDFPRVTLVGVVSADGILGLPDFRAGERTFQLLTQMAGRAGRGELPGRVVVQSYYPDHYAIQFGARQDYNGFYEKELEFRRLMHYPPFTALASVIVRDRKLERAIGYARVIEKAFAADAAPPARVRVLGPAPAALARLKRDFRFQFLLKATDRRMLQETLRGVMVTARQAKIPAGALLVDVDPISLL